MASKAKTNTLTSDLKTLLRFIRGEGHHWGPGIMTRPWLKEKQALHEDCVKLEEMSLIYRHYEDGNRIVGWMPTQT